MSLKTFSCRVLSKFLNPNVGTRPAAAVLGQRSARGLHPGRLRDPGPDGAAPVRVLDLRSDAMTNPGPAMRQAMAEVELGGDLLTGEDPTVDELQKIAAAIFQMEAALFVPSTTMGNLIAVMAHCREREDEMIVGDLSYLHVYGQGGSAQVAGVHSTTVTNFQDGSFDLEQLESKIRHIYPKSYSPRSRLICVENTHSILGGRVLPLAFLQEVRALADRYGLSVYMDGARVMNAAVALGVPLPVILQHTHSVSVCLSKGLGAPMGTILAGPRDFILRAVQCRNVLGGEMLKIGMLAAAGKLALLEMIGRLEEDHCNAKTFAQALHDCDPPLFSVDVDAVETNIVRFHLPPGVSNSEFCALMAHVGEGEEAALGQGVQVRLRPYFGNTVRVVFHLGISAEDTQLAIQKMQFVASQYLKKRVRGC